MQHAHMHLWSIAFHKSLTWPSQTLGCVALLWRFWLRQGTSLFHENSPGTPTRQCQTCGRHKRSGKLWVWLRHKLLKLVYCNKKSIPHCNTPSGSTQLVSANVECSNYGRRQQVFDNMLFVPVHDSTNKLTLFMSLSHSLPLSHLRERLSSFAFLLGR